MPKLTKDSLEKRFTCHYCGNSFRTRQGLSGHIQFKHNGGQEPLKKDFGYVLSKGKDLEAIWKAAGYSMSDIRTKQHILAKWLDVQAFCDFLKIKLNDQDFKNYIVARLAKIHDKET